MEIFSPGFNLAHTTLYKWTKYNTRLWWLVLELVNNFLEFINCQCPWVFLGCKNKIYPSKSRSFNFNILCSIETALQDTIEKRFVFVPQIKNFNLCEKYFFINLLTFLWPKSIIQVRYNVLTKITSVSMKYLCMKFSIWLLRCTVCILFIKQVTI